MKDGGGYAHLSPMLCHLTRLSLHLAQAVTQLMSNSHHDVGPPPSQVDFLTTLYLFNGMVGLFVCFLE